MKHFCFIAFSDTADRVRQSARWCICPRSAYLLLSVLLVTKEAFRAI